MRRKTAIQGCRTVRNNQYYSHSETALGATYPSSLMTNFNVCNNPVYFGPLAPGSVGCRSRVRKTSCGYVMSDATILAPPEDPTMPSHSARRDFVGSPG